MLTVFIVHYDRVNDVAAKLERIQRFTRVIAACPHVQQYMAPTFAEHLLHQTIDDDVGPALVWGANRTPFEEIRPQGLAHAADFIYVEQPRSGLLLCRKKRGAPIEPGECFDEIKLKQPVLDVDAHHRSEFVRVVDQALRMGKKELGVSVLDSRAMAQSFTCGLQARLKSERA